MKTTGCLPETSIRTDRLLERFLRYVRVGSAARSDTQDYPSSAGQLALGKVLLEELLAMGVRDAHQDEHGLIWGTLDAVSDVPAEQLPTILFNAHLDTSPEAPGDGVQPQVIPAYAGGDIPLVSVATGETRTIRVADAPVLEQLIGHTLITTDGTTLLGGDDKAGVAVIMELVQTLIENPHCPHGPVRVLFTCDEEIGRGAQHMDLNKAGADAAYTLDGSGQGMVENENFSADHLTVHVQGYNIHPSIAQGKMVNALRGAAKLVAALPLDQFSPESTSGTEGFVHPYEIDGGVDKAVVKILLRDFDTPHLDQLEQLVQKIADDIMHSSPGLTIQLQRTPQYRNMADGLRRRPEVVDFALQAHEVLGETPQLGSIRGGTDGAQFTAMGLPTPNLSVGQHNIHSVLEFASLNEMSYALRHAVALLGVWHDCGQR